MAEPRKTVGEQLHDLRKRVGRIEIIVAVALLTPKVGGPGSIPDAVGALITWIH